MRIDRLPQARRILEEEADYLASRNPDAAHDMLQTIRSSVKVLAGQPGSGRPGRVPGTRELVIQGHSYLIPYRVRGDVLEVLRVFHTVRKPPEKW